MESRTQKQIFIGLLFLIIIGGTGYVLTDYFFIIETTCFDGMKNGDEEGVDCGLVACGVTCEQEIMPLEVKTQKLLEIREGDYDFVAQVYNPNSIFGSSRARYRLSLNKADGTLSDKTGVFYILPGQTRFITIPGIRSDDALAGALIKISDVEWQKIEAVEDIRFSIQRKSYTELKNDGNFSELEAIVLNNSDFDFDKVEVGVILFDSDNQIIAVNRTDIRTFLSRTERYFKVSWPTKLPTVARQDIEVLTNVFENANFIRRHGTQERFQKYY